MQEEKTYERHDCEGTPFSIIVEQPTGKCKIAVAMQFVTDTEFNNEEEAKNYIDSKPWELILNTTIILHQNLHKLEEREVKNA